MMMMMMKSFRGGVDPDINVKMPSRTKGGITETVIKVFTFRSIALPLAIIIITSP